MIDQTYKTIDEMEADLIKQVLQTYNWNLTRACKVLGISRAGLYRKVSKYGIQRGQPCQTK